MLRRSRWLSPFNWPPKPKEYKYKLYAERLDSMPDKYKFISVKDVYDARRIREETERATERMAR
jgi:hypothetical protein